jgi:hypothetical protein
MSIWQVLPSCSIYHLRDKHSENMAQKVVFGIPQATVANQVDAETKKPVENVQNEKPTEKSSQTKTVAQAKAAYSFPWWALLYLRRLRLTVRQQSHL